MYLKALATCELSGLASRIPDTPIMLGTFILLYILPYIIWERPKEKPSASGRDLGLCIILPIGPKSRQVTRRYPLRCNIRTGERNISRSREAFLHRVRRRHVSATVQQRGANRVRDLTNMIVRTHEYPAAYGGFSDVWSCQLQCQRSPPERVCFPSMESLRWVVLIIGVCRWQSRPFEP